MIHLNNQTLTSRISVLYLKKKIHKILSHLKLSKKNLSITFVDDAEIKKINYQYRKKNRPTDVLSFPVNSEFDHLKRFLGDIIISTESAKKQAIQNNLSFRDEYLRLIIHGILHLIGYDHQTDEEYLEMNTLEKKLWNLVKG
jgi:probable rRNA maturation factor